MRLPATALIAFALLASSSCSSKLIRLGDGASGAAGVGVAHAGASGSSAGSGGVANSAGAALGGRAALGDGGALGGSAGEPSDEAGAGGMFGEPCQTGQVRAEEVLWIGDSWIERTDRKYVSDQAHDAGALLEPDEEYPSLAVAGALMKDVAAQYQTGQARGTPIKVLLMDGGTYDPIDASFKNASVTDAIENSVSAFRSFLEKVASDGTVEHLVYVLVPDLPTIVERNNIGEKLRSACGESEVPCHFIDLQPMWEDHPEYTDVSGIQPSADGARVIAEAIWETMQEHCIAR